MKIYLVRHTKPAVPDGICYGQTDLDVGDTFEMESKTVQEQLSKTHISQVFSSPLLRCTRLARSFISKFGSVIYDDRLKEFNFGHWEMKPWTDIAKDPRSTTWYSDYINVPVPGGDSFMDLIERVRDFTREIFEDYSGQDLLIICHGGVIRAFNIIIKGTDPISAFDLKVDYGEVQAIEILKPL